MYSTAATVRIGFRHDEVAFAESEIHKKNAAAVSATLVTQGEEDWTIAALVATPPFLGGSLISDRIGEWRNVWCRIFFTSSILNSRKACVANGFAEFLNSRFTFFMGPLSFIKSHSVGVTWLTQFLIMLSSILFARTWSLRACWGDRRRHDVQ